MRKSQAARYAQWSAAAAALCAVVTLGVYLKRGYTRHEETKNAPPAPAVNVERQSTKLTFSKGEGTRTIFTVEAMKSIDLKGLNISDLEGVKVTIFGKGGDRHDTLETHSCRYSKDSGDFDCSGDVEITLMSKEEWEAAAGRLGAPGTMKVETRGMVFNRASGEAKTDEKVRFRFASGSGEALGAAYNSERGTLELLHDVRLKLEQPADPGKAGSAGSVRAAGREPVDVTGSRMDLRRDAGTMYLSGPVEAKTSTERLTASAFLLNLDSNFRAKRLVAKRNGADALPEFTAQHGPSRQRLSAEEIAADFAPQGWVVHAEARGQVSGDAVKGEQTQAAKADSAEMEMTAKQNAPKLLTLKGNVDARSTGAASGGMTAEMRKLTTDELRIAFAEKSGATGTRPQSAETVGPGRLEWNDPESANGKAAQTVLAANQLSMQFDAKGAASRLDAKGKVQSERTVAGTRQTASGNIGSVDLLARGGWSRMQLNENVQLNETAANGAQRAARADEAVFVRAEQTATLTGHATAKDATSQTSAEKLTFWQGTGAVRGEGKVRSSDLSARGSALHLAPVASNATADHLEGNSKTGRAVYTGHARLWQGDSVLEAESIELLRNERVMNAEGNVRAVFPQTPSANAANQPGSTTAGAAKGLVLWHAQSGKLTYWDGEGRAHLSQGVVVQAPDQKMTGPELELYFTRAAANGGQAGNAAAAPGAQQISRAIGTGGVLVQQGERRATAERGVYTATEGKFVMSGGNPTLFDAEEGTTTGRQLTFFLADATIIVDSESGSRTLTKHRVEK